MRYPNNCVLVPFLQENLTKQQMRFNEARFHQLLHMQGIILIAQIVTVCSGYKFLLAWDPDLLIHFLEVHVEKTDDVDIICKSQLMTFMNGVWESGQAFKCRKGASHVIPPGCLLLRVNDPLKKIQQKCPLFLTTQGQSVEKLLRYKPIRWQEKYAYLHAHGSRTAEHIVHLLTEMFPGIRDSSSKRHADKIKLAVKCYNLHKGTRDYGQLRLGTLIKDRRNNVHATKLKTDAMKTKDKAFLLRIYTRCGYNCTGKTVSRMLMDLHLKMYERGESIEDHQYYFWYSMVTTEDKSFLQTLAKDNTVVMRSNEYDSEYESVEESDDE